MTSFNNDINGTKPKPWKKKQLPDSLTLHVNDVNSKS